jgi:hypothetical protein
MIFPGMIAQAATNAGMKVPANPDDMGSWELDDFPHFAFFCIVQLGVQITWGNHWHNAEIIANIPEDKLRKMDYDQLYELGFSP